MNWPRRSKRLQNQPAQPEFDLNTLAESDSIEQRDMEDERNKTNTDDESTLKATMQAMANQLVSLQKIVIENQEQARLDRETTARLETLIRENVVPRLDKETSSELKNIQLGPKSDGQSLTNVESESESTDFASTSTLNNNNYLPDIRTDNLRMIGHRKVLDLPAFSGRPEDWPMFIATYQQTTEMYRYSDLENMTRLQKCLSGEAKEEVACLLMCPDNVNNAIESLESRFGRPAALVRSQLRLVQSIPPINDQNINQLIPFASKVKNLVAFLDAPKTRQHLTNPTLIDELIMKLPVSQRIDWAKFSARIDPYPTLKDFSQWVSEAAKFLSMVDVESTLEPSSSRVHRHKPTSARNEKTNFILHSTEPTASSERKCISCEKSSHSIQNCPVFVRLSVDDRWLFVRSKRLCFLCLRLGHGSDRCRNRKPCKVDNCKRHHHPLLHSNRSAPLDKSETTTSETTCQIEKSSDSNMTKCVLNCHDECEPKVLFRVIAVKLFGPKSDAETYALLDEGSSVTMLDEDLATKLGLDGPSRPLNLQWFGNRSASEPSKSVQLQISGSGSAKYRFEINNVRTVRNLCLPSQSILASKLHTKYHPLKGLPIADMSNAFPKLLIGLDNCHLGASIKQVECVDGPIAAKTKLGWVVFGPCSEVQSLYKHPATVLHVRQVPGNTLALDDIHQLVEDYFTTDNFGVLKTNRVLESDMDERARLLLQQTTIRVGNRFQTGLLWKDDKVSLPDSKTMALNRLKSIERKMSRDPIYAEAYKKNIADYVEKGYAYKLTELQANETSDRTWYLPHFGVRNPHKPEKLRLVFDAAAKVGGISLNSSLLTGPDLNKPLSVVLHQFRMGEFGITGDIKEMFHQVLIRSEDHMAQRFLWRNDSSLPVETYAMAVMIFGAACSPCSAQYVKNINADEFEKHESDAVSAIKNNHYVDDYVASFKTIDNAIQTTRSVIDIHRSGGFELRNFLSNCPDILQAIDQIDRTHEQIDMQLNKEGSTEKVLGMFWDTKEDVFRIKLNFLRVDSAVILRQRRPTKREMLSIAMSVFDPFGMVADYMIYAKRQLQDIWKSGIDWDAPIADDQWAKWTQWMDELKTCEQTAISRCYSPHFLNSTNIQLHIFADASEVAFASVAYWRIERPDNNFDIAFITGKTRCAPLKLLSIPRLELQAAVLATRIAESIKSSHDINVNSTTFWTDSKTVFQWVRSDHRKYKPFVAHRIAEILEISTPNSWRWVPTLMNPADVATRTKYPPNCQPNGRWLKGPDFLKFNECDWPTSPVENIHEVQEEIRPKYVLMTQKPKMIINFSRFSKYIRLRRALAWVYRYMSNLQSKSRSQSKELSASELNKAELKLCQIAQIEGFFDDYIKLKHKKSIDSSSSIFKLCPYIDDNDVMRMSGRTDAADYLPISARRPILLPKDHRLTELLVKHHHEEMKHQHEEAIICSIRQRFWIPHLRSLVRKEASKCLHCRIRKASAVPPIMGQLPKDRVTPYVRPFSYTGLDYFGPVNVAIGRRREKRWIALFTCLTVRAIHLEIATDLSTDSCLLCIRNFCNIRGVPVRIRSDNGTNFVGAAKDINTKNIFDNEIIAQELGSKGIEWIFNSPGHPEAGGCWERMVQSVKKVLAITLKETAPHVETLRSLLLEAANIINSRPLTHIPVDTNEEPLTPNHFLVGTMNSTQTPGIDNQPLHCLRKQWRIAQHLKNMFWKKWLQEYLPDLTRRTKWFKDIKSLAVGDLVLICDTNLARGQWKRGRIVDVFPGPDGRVRNASVKTTDGVLKRPTSKLALLDVNIS